MQAVLVHGLGQTPLSMAWLATRLSAAGIHPAPFGYSAFERIDPCLDRLCAYVNRRASAEPYVLIGHSFGSVLVRAVLPRLAAPPSACFLLAPIGRAPRSAKTLATWGLLGTAIGKMGQALADEQFIGTLPIPRMTTRVYAGVGGPVGPLSPFGSEANDGMLALSETRVDSVPVQPVAALHPFVMNSEIVISDILTTIRDLREPATA